MRVASVSRRRNLLVGWPLAALAIVAFVSLGVWQSRRAVEKQAMLDAAAQVLAQRQPVPLLQASDPGRARSYDWTVGTGSFSRAQPLLLDNQMRGGRPGVRVYRVFYPDAPLPYTLVGDALLIDMGWLPLAGDRTLPKVGFPVSNRIEVRGLLAPPPSTGLALGAGIVRQEDAWLLTRIDLAAIGQVVNGTRRLTLAPRVLRLDPSMPLGFERDLDVLPNTLPPERHRAYAWQWFALALAVLATALILTFRKPKP
ncbi:SURF1 family protein [Lysobacter sp. CFH 32150]|nr:SURF1 family protein [Lysobacter sp. CFH 32150]MCI4569412.1 SURF1 family protein [Lysobacter sp. CFH 32150]